MLGSITSGLDDAMSLPSGRTNLDLGAYFRQLGGVTTAGMHAEVSSHFSDNWAAFGRVSVGVRRDSYRSDLEAIGLIGLRGRLF